MSDVISRSWFVVFCNPEEHGYLGTPEEIIEKLKNEWIENHPLRKGWWAYAISAKGLRHVHMVLEDSCACRFSKLKKIYPSANLQVTKGTRKQVMSYIKKEPPYDEKGEKVIAFTTYGNIEGYKRYAVSTMNETFAMIEVLIEEGMTPNQIMAEDIRFRREETLIRKCYFAKRSRETPPLREVKVFWHLVRDDKTFILGISILGATVSWSLNMYVNALIAGATGSGKSAVFRLICYQAIRKGMLVYIASFKGGFDFNITWRKGCKIITHEKEFLNTLNLILLEKEKRTELLLAAGCVDIDEYNSESTKKLKRIFLALDEAAELLDKDGLKKSTDGEKLELLKEIEQKLTSLSRTGRAFGIHMVFATQKPSATIINGQIKSNLEARMCGSSDNILSQMVLDNNCASEMIPSGSKGVFIDQSRIMFKAYLLDEENLSF